MQHPIAISFASLLAPFTFLLSPFTLHAVTFPARCVRVTADPAVGAVSAPLIVEEWQAVDGGTGQLLSRINHRKLVISPGQQVSVEWPVSNSYVRLPPAGSYLWRSPCAGGLARFGLFSASPDSLSISAGGRTAASVYGVPQLAAPYPLPYGTSRPAGSLAADGSAIDVQLSRFVAASGATVRVTWTPVSASLSEAYAPLPSGGDLATNVTIAVTADIDGNGKYTPGEPFGVTRMAYGDYAAPEICLTRVHPAIMRVDLASAVTHNDYASQAADCDRRIVGYGAQEVLATEGSMPHPSSTVRVRLALSAISGRGAYNNVYADLIAFDRRINLAERPTIDESMLYDTRTSDLGWGELGTQATSLGLTASFNSSTWRIVLGDGTVSPTQTNCNLKTSFVNFYEASRSSATPLTPANTEFRGFPRFTWSFTSTASYAIPYPTWRVQVHSAATGGDIVYSQLVASLCQNADGNFAVTIPMLPGALGNDGTPISAVSYWWSVTPCDAKFTTFDNSAARRKFTLASD